MAIFHYTYKHSSTDGVTGYFSCEPDAELAWPDSLRALSERPSDLWLQEHVLKQAAALDNEQKHAFEIFCQNPEDCAMPGLAEMNAALSDEFLQVCRVLSSKLFKPAAAAKSGKEKELYELGLAARANIHFHQPMPQLEFEYIEWPRENTKTRKPALEGGREAGFRNWADNTDREKLKSLAESALRALEKANLLHGPEMRHESSLSPVALLRQWNLQSRVLFGAAPYHLAGLATAYGKGFSLAQARVSCLMEIVERASAHATILENGEFLGQSKLGGLIYGGMRDLKGMGRECIDLRDDQGVSESALFWVKAENYQGKKCLIPASEVFLFLNLPEEHKPPISASTGLASHTCVDGARLKALLEVMERHAHATMPHRPENCFSLASEDALVQSLLADYKMNGINVYFEDITTENGLPVYRCFVGGKDGNMAQATAAGLNGREALLSALCETPWPYAYSRPVFSAKPSIKMTPPPTSRYLESLPDYSEGSADKDLAKLEKLFCQHQYGPVYVNLTRDDLLFPVFRCFIPAYEIDSDYDDLNLPGSQLMLNVRELLRK